MLVPAESIMSIAECAGIENLDKKVATSLANDVEYRLREIVQDALKFMGHAHQKELRTTDIDAALKLKNIPALYGYSSPGPMNFEKVKGRDDLFYVRAKQLRFDEVISEALPPPPKEMTFSVHWLAVDGVQPAIPENPSNPNKDSQSSQALKDAQNKEPDIKNVVKHVLNAEEQMYFRKVTQCIKSVGPDDLDAKHADERKVNEKLRSTALKSLQHDAGLHQLLPYFVQFIADETVSSIKAKNLPVLKSLMMMTQALCLSKHLNISHYMQQLMPAICSCLLTRRANKKSTEDHWSLRDHAAKLLRLVCDRFKTQYPEVQMRVTETLTSAFMNHIKPMTTHYGAIVGLAALGPLSVRKFLLPYVKVYLANLRPQMSRHNREKRREAHKVYGALLQACGRYIQFEFSKTNKKIKTFKLGGPPPIKPGESSSSSSLHPQHKIASLKVVSGKKRKREWIPKLLKERGKKHQRKRRKASPDKNVEGESKNHGPSSEKMEIDSPPPPPPPPPGKEPQMKKMTKEMQDKNYSVGDLLNEFGESIQTYTHIKRSYISDVFI